MHQIEYLLDLALLDDERGQKSQAEKMYNCAIEVALEAVSHLGHSNKIHSFYHKLFKIPSCWYCNIN